MLKFALLSEVKLNLENNDQSQFNNFHLGKTLCKGLVIYKKRKWYIKFSNFAFSIIRDIKETAQKLKRHNNISYR